MLLLLSDTTFPLPGDISGFRLFVPVPGMYTPGPSAPVCSLSITQGLDFRSVGQSSLPSQHPSHNLPA